MEQSIANGTVCRFNHLDMIEDIMCGKKKFHKVIIEMIENTNCKIMNLATFTGLGKKDFEYYNVIFDNDYVLQCISGRHLTPLINNTKEILLKAITTANTIALSWELPDEPYYIASKELFARIAIIYNFLNRNDKEGLLDYLENINPDNPGDTEELIEAAFNWAYDE